MQDHSGWRARIGLIYMASSTIMEPEFYAMSPEGVATCTVRTHLPKMDIAGLEQMTGSDDLERCTAYLARADLGVIAYGGTSATFLHGPDWDRKMQDRMRPEATAFRSPRHRAHRSPPCGRSAPAGSRSSVLMCPRSSNAAGGSFLQAVSTSCRRMAWASMMIMPSAAFGTEQVYQYAKACRHREADAVFISCTNLASVAAIDRLESDLGIPVVSAVQATFWQCLRMTGVNDRLSGFGQLFAH